MSKAILVIDMPETCEGCEFMIRDVYDYCILNQRDVCFKFKPDWCPLIPAIGYIEAKGNMISWEDEE